MAESEGHSQLRLLDISECDIHDVPEQPISKTGISPSLELACLSTSTRSSLEDVGGIRTEPSYSPSDIDILTERKEETFVQETSLLGIRKMPHSYSSEKYITGHTLNPEMIKMKKDSFDHLSTDLTDYRYRSCPLQPSGLPLPSFPQQPTHPQVVPQTTTTSVQSIVEAAKQTNPSGNSPLTPPSPSSVSTPTPLSKDSPLMQSNDIICIPSDDSPCTQSDNPDFISLLSLPLKST
jgi:hypothetical protein